jgi:hypothetical protein
MSLSRSPIWTQRYGLPTSSDDRRKPSSHRRLSFSSIGIRVGLIFLFIAVHHLNWSRVQK